MATRKLSVSFEGSLAAAVRKAAVADGVSISAWEGSWRVADHDASREGVGAEAFDEGPMSLLLDAGALIAFERGSRVVQAFLERAARGGEPVRTTAGVIAQVWRRPSVQSRVARLLRGVDEAPLESAGARRTGILLGAAKRADVVGASLIDLARDGDEVLTSDPDDLTALAYAAGKTLIITPV